MKHIIIYIVTLLATITVNAQSSTQSKQEQQSFKGKIINSEYDIYINMDLENSTIIVPQQEIFGEIPGYLGDNKDARKWLFTDAKITSDNKATISIINDYGSEELTASLQIQNDTTYILNQESGSTIKVARNRKWVKLPQKLIFIKKDMK